MNRLLVYLLTSIGLFACNSAELSDPMATEELVLSRCSSCHLYPKPELLPREKWEVVLPRMGARLGIPDDSFDPFAEKAMDKRFLLEAVNIYPKQPLISESDWKRIKEFILEQAPEKLVLAKQESWESSSLFKSHFPEVALSSPASVTLVEFDQKTQAFYLADRSGNFGRVNQEFSFLYQSRLPRPIIDIEKSENGALNLLTIGVLYPDESSSGAAVQMSEDHSSRPALLFDKLPRPVYFTSADLDHDDNEDFIVCAFGNDLGKFSWFEKKGQGFNENTIKEVPGATRVYAEDLDGNGFQDLITLFAQGDEGISIFYNEEGKLKEKRVLRFPPAFGSNDFEFIDFDGDKDKDIILTNGDNGDQSNVLKPYHGVRVFLNNGEEEFEEKYFFPFYGASKVRCRDFDLDGDMDLFIMSFFPDFKEEGKHSLVYLENLGDWEFKPFEIEGATEGRWMVMDAGDPDQDGDEDLLIGSFVLNSIGIEEQQLQRWKGSNRKLLFLENRTKP